MPCHEPAVTLTWLLLIASISDVAPDGAAGWVPAFAVISCPVAPGVGAPVAPRACQMANWTSFGWLAVYPLLYA